MDRIDRIARMLVAANDRPAVYVGTYAKYNSGDLTGKWLYLDDYSSKDDFIEACKELHNDEEDPELMFQDFENFPEAYYSESDISEETWDYIDKCGEYDKDIVDAILDNGGKLDDVDNAMVFPNCYDMTDVAQRLIDETGGIEALDRETLERYFDYDSYGRDLEYDLTFIRYEGGYIEIR